VKRSASPDLDMAESAGRGKGPHISAIFVHAGAGYHSVHNEGAHLAACNEYDPKRVKQLLAVTLLNCTDARYF
jgi:hypothetical protein